MDYPGGFSVMTSVVIRGDRRARVSGRYDSGSQRFK